MNGMPAAVLSVLVQARGIQKTNAELTGTQGVLNAVHGAAGRVVGQLMRLAKYGALAAAAGIGVAVKRAIDFDKEMRNVNSIAQISEKALGRVRDKVLELAGKTAQAPVALASGMYDLVSSGFDAEESLQILGKSAKAATAGLTSAEVSTAAVAAVLNAYQLKAGMASDVSDVLFRIVDRGVISFESLASNVGDVLPFAASLSIDLREVGASIATMTKAGISAPETMTRIKAVMVSLLKPGEDLKNAIEDQGYASGEAMIKALGFQGTLDALAKSTGGSKEAMGALFPNVRALGGALALTGANSKVAAEDLKGMQEAAGATDRALSQQSKSISYQWNQLKATAEALGIQFGTKLLPELSRVMKIITNPNLTTDEKVTAVFDTIVAKGTEGLKALIGAAEQYGPEVVGALASGMVSAWGDMNPLGKLLTTAAIIRVVGGRGAITAAGKTIGRWLGAGVSTAAAAEIASSGAIAAAATQSVASASAGPALAGAASRPSGAGALAGAAAWTPSSPWLGSGALRKKAAEETSRALLAGQVEGFTLASVGNQALRQREAGFAGRMQRWSALAGTSGAASTTIRQSEKQALAAQGGIFGGIAGSAAGKSAGGKMVGGITGALKKVSWGRVGGLGVGLALADGILTAADRRMREGSDDLREALGAKTEDFKIPLVADAAGLLGVDFGKIGPGALGIEASVEQSKKLKGIYDAMLETRVKFDPIQLKDIEGQAQALDLTEQQREGVSRMISILREGSRLGVKVNLGTDPEELRKLSLGFYTLRSGVLTSMGDIGKVVRDNAQVIATQLPKGSRDARVKTAENFRAAATAIGKGMAAGDIEIKEGLRRQKELFRNAKLVTGEDPVGIARGFRDSWRKAGGISAEGRRDMIADLAKMPPAARRKAFDTMIGFGQELARGKKIPLQDLRDFRSAAVTQFEDLRGRATQSSLDLAVGIAGNFGSMGTAVGNVLTVINKNTNNSLEAFGAKPVSFSVQAVGDVMGLLAKISKPNAKQQGGFIVPGNWTGDRPGFWGEAGGYVLNREATGAFGFRGGGAVPLALESGERYFSPPEVKAMGAGTLEAMNRSVKRQQGGSVGPRVAGPAGPLLDIAQGVSDEVGGAAQRYVQKQRPKASSGGGNGFRGGSGSYPGVTGDTDFIPALGNALSEMARATNNSISVTSGWRSRAEQAALYAAYLNGTGNLAAPPGSSNHEDGRAADIAPGRETFGAVASQFGLGFTVPSESWHIELLKLGGLVQGLMKGGHTKGPKPPNRGSERFQAIVKAIWREAAPLYGDSPDSPAFLPTLVPGLSKDGGPLAEAGTFEDGSQGFRFDRGWARRLAGGNRYAKKTLLHEWAHLHQPVSVQHTDWEAEGGADAFSRWASQRLWGYTPAWAASYRKFGERVIADKGWDWIKHGQFKQLGGPVQALSGGGGVKGIWAGTSIDKTYPISDGYSGETLPFFVAAALGEWAGLPGVTMAQIGKSETNLHPGTSIPDPPGESHSWLAINDHYNNVSSAEMRNPINAILKAKEIVGGGLPNSNIWHANKYVTGYNQHYTAHDPTDIARHLGGSGKNSDAHTYKEDVPSLYRGLRTKDISFPSMPKTLQGVGRELHRWQDEIGRYRHAVKAARNGNHPAVVQALEANVTEIEAQLRKLRHERKKLRVGVARKSFSRKLGRQLSKITGYETSIEQAREAYERRSQDAEQIVALEPVQQQLSSSASEQQRQAAEEAYVRELTGYVEGRERPAYQAVLSAAGSWRNTILGAEHGATRREVGWEGQLRTNRVEAASIDHYVDQVSKHVRKWQQGKEKGEKMPDWLRSEVGQRDRLRERLPMLRFQDGELQKTLGEARGAFFPGTQWIDAGKLIHLPGVGAVRGTGSPIDPPIRPLPGTGSFEDALRETQGTHWPGGHEVLASLPAERVAGRFGGAIWEAQSAISELGLKTSDAAAGIQAGGPSAEDTEKLANLEQLLRESNQRTAVAERQGAAMASWDYMRQGYGGKFAGLFAKGGFIPPGKWGIAGETGLPEIVHGGRAGATVLPPSDSAAVLRSGREGDGPRGGAALEVNVRGGVVPAAGVSADEVIEVLERDPRSGEVITRKVFGAQGVGVNVPGNRV